MRLLLQRVSRAEVRVQGRVVARIGRGLLVMVGVSSADTLADVKSMAEKVVNLRVFADDAGKMNLSLLDTRASVLCVSQLTLYGDCRKGRRPSFDRAASPGVARPLYEALVGTLRGIAGTQGATVETGQFQAMMEVELVNDGPVTLLLDSAEGL
jgi:D-aminoacyl-tRNA deacylase